MGIVVMVLGSLVVMMVADCWCWRLDEDDDG